MDPFIRYRYTIPGHHGRTVEAQCSSAHRFISDGRAEPLAEDLETYNAWCADQGEEPHEAVEEPEADEGPAVEEEEVLEAEEEVEADEPTGAEADEEPETGEAESEVEEAIDLVETPVAGGRLAAEVAEVTDPEFLETLAAADDRTSAQEIYAARIEELQGEPEGE